MGHCKHRNNGALGREPIETRDRGQIGCGFWDFAVGTLSRAITSYDSGFTAIVFTKESLMKLHAPRCLEKKARRMLGKLMKDPVFQDSQEQVVVEMGWAGLSTVLLSL